MTEGYDALARELVGLLTDRGLGAVAKRDLDALLLYFFESHLGRSALSSQQFEFANETSGAEDQVAPV
jgi:hypothetical protein